MSPDSNASAKNDSMQMLDRVEELVSLLIDDALSDERFEELSGMLEKSLEARSRYVEAIQLHVDLREYYARRGGAEVSDRTPVLGLLGAEIRTDLLPPSESGVHGGVHGLDAGS